ncbi:ABC transporter substrate-binding protein [Candidatus Clostridium radicumherbarum]|uniref:ABC transporter substrate-binding protein n=1 Tax=Candidatus Clostridium radicumherbarum TaxID=3381662 RepID=A0ABW8TPR4_9CLOT
MKSKISKILALVLSTATVASLAAGCSSKTASTSSGQPVTLTFMMPGDPPKDENNVLAAVNKQLKADGLNFNIKTSYVADYWNKLAMTVAGGTEVDIAWAHSSTLSGLAASKVYQPIDSVFASSAPDVKANTPDYVLKGGTVNGKLYALPRVIPMANFDTIYNIRGDLREKYGLAPIKTISDLEKYFDAVKKNNPDMYPVGVDNNMQPLFAQLANYFFPIGDGGQNPVYVDPADPTHTVKTFFDSPAFEQVCAVKKSWVAKGYIPADSSKVTDANEGFVNGKVACIPSNTMSASERIDSLTASIPNGKIETVLLTDKPYIFIGGDNMLAVPSTSKHVKEAVEFINWIKKNQANYDLWSFGVKGTNYNLSGDSVSLDGIPADKQYVTNSWMWNDIRIARFSSKMSAEDITTLKNWDKNAEKTPFIGFTLDQTKIKSQVSQVSAVWAEYYDNLAAGSVDYNKVKAEVQAKLKAAGIDDIVKETQAQLNTYLAANK